MSNDYYLGLDLGVNSVGFAATDEEYNILKYDGQPIYGSRLMDSMEQNAVRRTNRTARRRLQKKKERIEFLDSIFHPLIDPIDPDFFSRLKNSMFYPDDKTGLSHPNQNIVFNDGNYKDKNYRADYPTIAHLKMALIRDEVPDDSRYTRLLYLAIHNFYIHRGNFLNDWMSDEYKPVDFKAEMKEVWELLGICHEKNLPELTDETLLKMEEILMAKDSRSQKKENLNLLLTGSAKGTKKESELVAMNDALTGLAFSPKNLVELSTDDEETKKALKNISFQSSDLDEKMELIQGIADDNQLEILLKAKAIHDSFLLKSLMGNFTHLSEARIASYDEYRQDLNDLKKLYKDYDPDHYSYFFRELHPNNYTHYVHRSKYYDPETKELVKFSRLNPSKDKKGTKPVKAFDYKEFTKSIERFLKMVPDDCEEKKRILKRIDNETLFKKQMTSENGIIPYQIHIAELKAILNIARKYVPELSIVDQECGLDPVEKILQVFRFRKPFYVGTTPNKPTEKSWAKRIKPGKIMPWTLADMVDLKETRKEYITHMVRSCTYIPDQKALPKQSIEYERFALLNQINVLSINGQRLDPEVKARLFQFAELHPSQKLTKKKIIGWLCAEGIISKSDMDSISLGGIDEEITARITALPKFRKLFGKNDLTSEELKIAEDIIFWSTVFGKDRSAYLEWLDETYGSVMSKEQIKTAAGYTFNGWGSLSKEFLHLDGVNRTTGESQELMERMISESKNLNEILFDPESDFQEKLKERNEQNKTQADTQTIETIRYKDLDELQLNPQVKRTVWQAILVVKDIIKAEGRPPARLFIEMPRSKLPASQKGQGKKTVSRRDQLLKLFKSEEYEQIRKDLERISDSQLDKDKFYLYFLQKGEDLYTGKPIDLNDLLHPSTDPNRQYDIDHIWPQSVTLDNSVLNNLVLTSKTFNEHVKKDIYPLPESVRKERAAFWGELRKKTAAGTRFLTEEKYSRLMRSTPFTDKERADFINRQLVDTGYSTRITAHLMESLLPQTEVIYTKSRLASELRKECDFVKVRELNDYHHAEDAYLNIVAGNVYYSKFSKDPRMFIQEWRKRKTSEPYSVGKLFKLRVRTRDRILWEPDRQQKNTGERIRGTSEVVERNLNENTPMVIHKVGQKTNQVISKTTIYSPKAKGDSAKTGFPVKTSDTRFQKRDRYGSYDSASTAYFALVTSEDKKGKVVPSFIPITTYQASLFEKNAETLLQYCENRLNMKKPEVIKDKILIGTLFEIDGCRARLTGRSENRLAIQFDCQPGLSNKDKKYLKWVISSDYSKMADSRITEEKNFELFELLIQKLKEMRSESKSAFEKIEAVGSNFVNCSLKEQNEILVALLGGFKKNGSINFGGKLGFNTVGVKKIPQTGAQKIVMLTSSPSGLFRKREVLWDGEH